VSALATVRARSRDPNASPEERRAALRVLVRDVANHAALVECSRDARALWAMALGIARQSLDRMLAADGDKQLSVADLIAGPKPVRRAVVAEIIDDDEMVVSLPDVSDDADDLALIMAAQKESAEVISTHLAALRDGRMCRAEGATLEREADEAIAALLVVRERARQAQREVVIGLPLRVAK
jgi:hypothetical protein